MPDWVEFCRTDPTAVVEMVRRVAESADPGEHGEGVEVVIEAPQRGLISGLLDGKPLDTNPREQARIGVTKAGGEVRYPFHVNLVTGFGGDAAHRVAALPGWARSNSAGLAFLVQKGRPGARPDWAGLVDGAVGALAGLRRHPPEDGWRALVDRKVQRT
ncbi:MAG: hypothetical protein J2P15_07505 [Micromonosporaceae bacterium]|nr:hypothetical protein [Micromonosporaceae bacterium]